MKENGIFVFLLCFVFVYVMSNPILSLFSSKKDGNKISAAMTVQIKRPTVAVKSNRTLKKLERFRLFPLPFDFK